MPTLIKDSFRVRPTVSPHSGLSVWLPRLLAQSGDLTLQVLYSTFSRPTTSHQFAPTHPFLHSFPQSILTFPCFNWQKGKGEGQCRTYFCMVGKQEEIKPLMQCIMYEICFHYSLGNRGLYQHSSRSRVQKQIHNSVCASHQEGKFTLKKGTFFLDLLFLLLLFFNIWHKIKFS